MSSTIVEITDERYITATAEELHDDEWFFGFARSPFNTAMLAVFVTVLGRGYFYVTNLNSSGAGSLAAAISAANAAGGGWIIFQVSGTWALSSPLNLGGNIVLDGRGQVVLLTGKGIDCNGQYPAIMNIWIKTVTGSNQRGINADGSVRAIFIGHCRFAGDIQDQCINITNATSNGISATISNPRFDYVAPSASFFNAGLNFGSHGSGDPSNAINNQLIYGTVHHPVFDGMEIRLALADGAYMHENCPFVRWRTNGIGSRTDVQGNIGEVWVDTPTMWPLSTTASHRAAGYDHPEASARIRTRDHSSTGMRLLGTLNYVVSEQNPGSVRDPQTFYDYSFPHTMSQAHDDFRFNRGGNVDQVTITGTMSGSAADDLIGKTQILNLPTGTGARTWNTTWGTTQQQLVIDALSRLTGVDMNEVYNPSDIVRTSASVVTCTASSNLSSSIPAARHVYFEGGPGIINASGDDLLVVKSWNHTIIQPADAGPGEGFTAIAQSSDDAKQNLAGTVVLSATKIQLDAIGQWAGLRFTGLPSFVGKEIASVTLYMYATDEGRNTPNYRLYMEKAENPVTFAAMAGNISGRARTDLSAVINTPDDAEINLYHGVSVGAWFDELIAQGWDPTTVVFIFEQLSDTEHWWFESYDALAGNPPLLLVTFSGLAPIVVPLTPTYVDIGVQPATVAIGGAPISATGVEISLPAVGVQLGAVATALTPIYIDVEPRIMTTEAPTSAAITPIYVDVYLPVTLFSGGENPEPEPEPEDPGTFVPQPRWVIDTPEHDSDGVDQVDWVIDEAGDPPEVGG